ncbi:MAG: hypothetical protein E7447_02080 [Ruminococcaceae bacterium]|nr:hypothetical protein [Oscillospiraceae bacterium]
MTETQKRIKAYQKALPHMRERVIAVVVLLAMSLAMVVSSSFAWMTLAINPEVSGLATTIAANGNLEIALSGIEGREPQGTQLGDGIGDVTETNLRWGNLVNLSHESYGLDFLTLRPASLNTEALDISPMIAVNYGEDGRVQGYLKDFAFSNYNAGAGVFDVFETTRYGVRAISSVTYSNAHAESFYNKQLDKITESLQNAKQQFSGIYGNNSYMNTVTALVGIHVSAMMGSDISCLSHMPNLNKIMTEMKAVRDKTGQAIVDIANLYLYDELSDAGQVGSYESLAYKLEDIMANNYSNDFVRKYSSQIKGLTNFVTMSKRVDNAATQMELAASTADGDVLWQRDLKKAVNYMCNVDKATLKTSEGEYTCAQLAGSKSTAAKIVLSGETPIAIIKEGALRDADQLLGTEMYVERVKVNVTLPDDFGYGLGGRTMGINCNVQTNAASPYDIPNAYSDAYTFSSGATAGDRGTPVAADTYAMAIDFWVRTNEANSLLMLEGEVLYDEEIIPVTGYDSYGQQVNLYEYVKIVTVDGQSTEMTVQVYWGVPKDAQDQTNVWVNADTHEVENVGNAQPTEMVTVKKTPIGYEGVNRVWNELDDPNSDYSQMIQGGISTTQGSGSCYIFYPETPEDQEQCKNLLAAMHVAFIDEQGNLLGYADMDVDSMVEDAGRVILPLKMRLQKDSIVIGKDQEGNDITESYYITPMVQNEAMRITAIIYLDGTNLSNSDVLSAGSINGQLNIQFGLNKMENSPLKDGDLLAEHYSITANLINKKTGTPAKLDDSMEFFDENNCEWDIELAIAGTEPSSVRGQFVSYINASQGNRQPRFTMTFDPVTRLWKARVPFSGPGDFRLRSIEIDGVDILLPGDQMLTIKIPGKSISSVLCTNWGGDGTTQSIMTADPTYKQEVRLVLNSSEGTISKVQGIFLGDNGKNVTVDFTTDGGVNYTGTANFTVGGNYEMTYVIVDGVYTPLNESLYKKLSLKLNLQTTVVLGQPVDQGYYDLQEEMQQAIDAAGTSEEKEAVKADYEQRTEEYLNLLHYGNGIAGDPNETGLGLVRDADGNMSLITDASEPLFIEVRCIITDDQGNILSNLKDVELIYSAGGISNQLDTDVLDADKNAGYYYGKFTLESNGVFSFSSVTFKEAGQNREYTIYSAVSAPNITAIQPAPMEYVPQAAYAPLVYDLNLNPEERVVYVKLKNAAAASMDITLINGNGDTAAPLAVTAGETDANNITTFAVQLPSDGYWKITSLKLKNVFYDGTFYTGQVDDPTTWLDLSQTVLDDDIGTCFITDATIKVSGNAPAQSYGGTFMSSHTVSGMYVEVLGNRYGEQLPLEQILREAGITADVVFSFKYELDLDSVPYDYTLKSGGTMPTYTFESVYDEAAHKAGIASMNFQMPGTYNPTWTVTIDAENNAYDYTYSYRMGTTKPGTFNYLNMIPLESVVVVNWTQLPNVTIHSIAPQGSHPSVYYSFSLLGNSWKSTTVTSTLAADKLSCTVYANMSPSGWKGTSMTQYPYVQLKLDNMGAASGATMTFKKGNAAATLYDTTSRGGGGSDFIWSSGNNIASRYVGNYDYGSYTSVTPAGTITGNVLKMTYGDLTFTFTMKNTITINNLAASA